MVQAANVNVGLNLEYASFVSGGEQARRAMVSNLAAIQKESARTAAALADVPNSLKGFSSANDNLKRFGNITQQVGYQVGDFAVQVAAGGSAITAFIQQGTQIAGAFGPVGAVIGAVGAVVGVFAKSLFDWGTEAETAQTKLDKLNKSTDEYKAAMERALPIQKAMLENQISIAAAMERDAEATAKATGEVVRLRNARDTLNRMQQGNPFSVPEQVPASLGNALGNLQPSTGVSFGGASDIGPELREALRAAGQKLARLNQLTESSEGLFPGLAAEKQRLEEYVKFIKPILDDITAAEKQADNERAAAAKTAAAADKQAAEAKAKLIASMDEEVAASARLTEAVGKGAYAQELANIENQKQKDLIEKTRGLKGEELELQKQKIEGLAQEARLRASINTATPTGTSVTQRQAETTSYEQYEKDAPAILKARLDDEKKAADKLNEIYAQPFKDLATNISRTLSSGIQDALSGEFDFATFAEGFGDIFADTLAASITAALTPALTSAAESFGDVMTSALKSSTVAGGGGTAGAPGTPPGLTMGGAALGGAAFGGITGGLYGAYAPGMKPGNYAGVGGAIGGGLGAGVGFAFGGPMGALVGGGLGSLAGAGIGGLFGGQNNLGNDRSAQAYRSGRGLTYSDASFSAENRQVTQGIIDQLTVLQEALETAGGAIGDFGLRLEAGNKSGITVNGKKYPDAQAALAASLEVLIGSTSGLTVSQQTVLDTTKAKDAQGIVADLGVATQFDQITFNGTELTRQLVALDAEMAAFGKRAQALGLDINAVAAAHEKQRQALIDAQAAEQHAIQMAIEGLAPSGNALEIQLRQLNDQVQELARAATAAGLPLDQLAAAHQRAAAQLVAAAAQARSAVNLGIAQLNPNTNPLDLQLQQLQGQVDSMKPALDAIGQNYDALAAAHQAAANKIINDYYAAQQAAAEAAGQARAQAEAQARAAAAQRQAEEAARREQILSFQAQVALLEAQPLEATIINIRESFRQLVETGKALGLTTQNQAQIWAAESRTVQAARKADAEARAQEQFEAGQDRRNLFSQLSSLSGDNSLQTQLYALETQFVELRKAAFEANIPMQNVAQAWARATDELVKVKRELEQNLRDRVESLGASDLQQNLIGIRANFRGLIAEAQDLGWATGFLSEAWKRAEEEAQAANREAGRALTQQIDLLDATPLERDLANIGDQFRDLRKAAEDLGWATGFLWQEQEKAEQAAIEAARKQLRETEHSLAEAQRSAAGVLDQFLGSFKEALSSRGIGQGVYSGASLTESGLKEFRETLKEARTGDTQALGSLVGVGQGAIQQARQTYGSTGAFAEIFEEVQRGLREQQGVLEDKRDALLSEIGTYQKETVDEIIRLRVQAIGDLRADFAKLSRDLVVAVEGRT